MTQIYQCQHGATTFKCCKIKYFSLLKYVLLCDWGKIYWYNLHHTLGRKVYICLQQLQCFQKAGCKSTEPRLKIQHCSPLPTKSFPSRMLFSRTHSLRVISICCVTTFAVYGLNDCWMIYQVANRNPVGLCTWTEWNKKSVQCASAPGIFGVLRWGNWRTLVKTFLQAAI